MHSFIFTESGLTLTACGVAQEFDRISDANEYLYDGLSLIVGALPFHRADAPRLFAPREYKFSSEPVTLESPDALPAVALSSASPKFRPAPWTNWCFPGRSGFISPVQ